MSNLVPFKELESMASYIVRSKLFGAKDESQAMSLMLLAQAEGCHPMTAIQDFDVVQGRPARKTHSILARFQAAGGSVVWEEINGLHACGTFTHKQGGSLRVEWTIEQAKKAGLTNKDNWRNYPQAMLRARCIAEGVRAVFPGAIGGMLTVEEAQDLAPTPTAKNMGQAEVVAEHVDVDAMIEAAEATTTDAEALQYWKDNNARLAKQPSDHANLKAAIAAHRQALKQKVDATDAARTIEMEPVKPELTPEELDAQRGGPQ